LIALTANKKECHFSQLHEKHWSKKQWIVPGILFIHLLLLLSIAIYNLLYSFISKKAN
jgi:hypothetical protein